MVTATDLRRLPAGAHSRTSCSSCKAEIVWAMTVAGPNGPGGKLMPLDPIEHPDGNVAVTVPHRGELRARVLMKDESVDRPLEYVAMPHFATCRAGGKPELPAAVIDLQHERDRRRRRRGGRR